MIFSFNLNLAELVTSLCLLSYPVINVAFHDEFGIIADQWRQSWKCLSLESLFSLSSQTSLAFTLCLSVYLTIHIPSVIHRTSSQKVTFLKVITVWLIFAAMGSALQLLEYARNTDPFNYFCFPFTTQFPSDPLVLGLHICMVILDSLLVVAIIISYGYLVVFTIRRQRNKQLESVGSKRKKNLHKLQTRMGVVILSTIRTWIPILCVQILVLLHITVLPEIYLWCILVSLPITLVIDPILVVRSVVV